MGGGVFFGWVEEVGVCAMDVCTVVVSMRGHLRLF